MPLLSKVTRTCLCCGDTFWGTRRANFCSSSCRGRHRRMQRATHGAPVLAAACEELLQRRAAGSASYSKLLPRIFRAAAAELTRGGWEPLELLITRPDDPAGADDTSPGGVEGEGRQRRKWLYPPDEEVLILQSVIRTRQQRGQSVGWYQQRLAALREAMTVTRGE
jgi:hypothetical protein